MYQVKTFNAIAKEGLAKFTANYQINQETKPDAYLIRSVDLHHQELPESLKVIVRAGAGVNNIPIHAATANGTAVFNTLGSNANAVKELVISILVGVARNLFVATDYAMTHLGADVSQRTEHDKTRFNGTELRGRTLAVIGLGHVGSLIANAGLDLGMHVIGYDPYLSVNNAWHISQQVERAATIKEAVEHADYVTVHVPKNAETTNLIGTAEIAAMPATATLLNYARGGIVNLKSVVEALANDQLHYFATDFGDSILANNPKVLITPHIGGSTIEAEVNGATQAAQEIMDYLETGNVEGSVNLPDLQVPFAAKHRFTIMHENVPNMVGQITTLMANAGLNIATMANAARKKTAYTIIDVDNFQAKQGAELIAALNKIPAVYRARLITAK